MSNDLSSLAVLNTDLDLIQTVQDVQLREGDAGVAVHLGSGNTKVKATVFVRYVLK